MLDDLMTFKKELDGRVCVDHWAAEPSFSPRLIRESQWVDLQGDVLTITVSNGSQRYRLLDPMPTDEDPAELMAVRAVRMDA